MDPQWREFCSLTHVTELGSKHVTFLDGNQSIKECIQVLKDNNITGAPVLAPLSTKAVGFVDVLDISAYAVYTWRALRNKASHEIAIEAFFNSRISNVIDFGKRDEFVTLNIKASALDCIELFHIKKCYRIGLVNDDKEVLHIVTLMDVMKFANQNILMLRDRYDTLENLGLLHACLMVRHDTPLSEALCLLVDNKLRGLALVDENQKLVASFSTSDLKGAVPDFFDLRDPTIHFLKNKSTLKPKMPPTSVPFDTKLVEAMKLFLDQKIHRIFINNNMDQLFGVVSVSDVQWALSSLHLADLEASA